jgi:AcrR family transcriptional regulator
MAPPPDTAASTPGLRERKKARTRAAIQAHALRLFKARGYTETTVDEIAEAAEVSPSTFFRYFPAKEDVVVHDALDPLLIEAYRAQPAELAPLPALRAAIRAVRAELSEEVWERERERHALLLGVPELRARMSGDSARAVDMLAAAIAERTGGSPADLPERTLAGALVGIALATLLDLQSLDDDYLDRFDRALGLLDDGLPI